MTKEDIEYDAWKDYRSEKEEVESELYDFIECDHQVSRELFKQEGTEREDDTKAS